MLLKHLEASLGRCKGRSGTGEFQFDCPFCGKRKGKPDKKGHLYVNPDRMLHGIRGWYFCHRCEARGPLSRIIKGYAGERTKKQLSNWAQFVIELKRARKREVVERESPKVSLPEDYVPVVKGTQAYEYLHARNISDEIIDEYRIGFGTKNLLNVPPEERRNFAGSGRIIFPDFDQHGEVLYWVARTYKGHKVKYKNPANADARDKVFNLARAIEYEDVIITEGVISAIAAGRNAVATYGKDVTSKQVSMLSAAGFSKYYVALDGDALKRERRSVVRPPALKLAETLQARGHEVWMVVLPYDEDPASVEDFSRFLEAAKRYDLALSVDLLLSAES